MYTKRSVMVCLLLAVSAALCGCSPVPDSLVQTTWKLTSLITPSGTEYDEKAYDAIIGETFYRFETEGRMVSSVGGQEDEVSYTYTYEVGVLKISSEDLECTGTVKRGEIRLKLGEEGEAILTEQTMGGEEKR